MNKKIKLSVIGSCVSRDFTNSRFNRYFKENFELVSDFYQSSIISMMSEKWDFDVSKLGSSLDEYSLKNIRDEMNKNFVEDVKNNKPEYIILDFFADVRFGVFKSEGKDFLTNNEWKFVKTEYYKRLKEKKIYNFDNNPEEFLELWKSKVDDFFSYIKKIDPSIKIILNKSRAIDYYIDAKGNKNYFSEYFRGPFNKRWNILDSYVENKYNVFTIDIMKEEEFYSTFEHPWGSGYVHYNMHYYWLFLSRVINIVLFDKRTK